MKLINLTQTQFRNYANLHSKRNFGQTIEYSLLKQFNNKQRLFLGLTDDNNNIHAATLIIISNITPTVKEAYAPNGFLIDYANYELVNIFIKELKLTLQKEKVTYLVTNPMFKYKTYTKNNSIIENNESLLYHLYQLNFENIGYNQDFEKYDIIIDNQDTESDIYKNFNRNTKRNIKEAQNMGITLHKGSISDLETSYKMFKKKTNQSLSYYQNLINTFNTKDNKAEIFFTKLNPHKFLINSKKLYEKEKRRNEQIHNNFQKKLGNISEKLLNKRLSSDNLLEKYSQNLNKAIKLNQQTEESIIIGTCIIIKNNKEIYFLIDGYNEKYRSIHSSHILKWAIIKKYHKLGYKSFNLGEINSNYQNKDNKYYGQYLYKIGFGGNIIEYPPNLLLVINKPMYSAYTKLNSIKAKFKRK